MPTTLIPADPGLGSTKLFCWPGCFYGETSFLETELPFTGDSAKAVTNMETRLLGELVAVRNLAPPTL